MQHVRNEGIVQSMTVGLVIDAWDDLDRVLEGVSPEEAAWRWAGSSSFAWTLAHVTELVDAWINVRFAGNQPHPRIEQPRYRAGGSGIADEWGTVRAAVDEVRVRARVYLTPLHEAELDEAVPYAGSVAAVRTHGRLVLRYALLRIVAHHYLHIGEIEAKRQVMGHVVDGDFPGQLVTALHAETTPSKRH